MQFSDAGLATAGCEGKAGVTPGKGGVAAVGGVQPAIKNANNIREIVIFFMAT
jgi:hypothetical protein